MAGRGAISEQYAGVGRAPVAAQCQQQDPPPSNPHQTAFSRVEASTSSGSSGTASTCGSSIDLAVAEHGPVLGKLQRASEGRVGLDLAGTDQGVGDVGASGGGVAEPVTACCGLSS